MAVNWYARALDVLAQDCNDCDSDQIVLEIAKRNPSVLVKAIEAICQRGREERAPWRKEFSELVRHGQMVRAIKLYRENTGSPLKEAKKAHDDERELVLREKLS